MTLKLDMNKAYDRVEWDFLEVVISGLGFNGKWINWTMKCVKKVTYSLIINGKPSNSFSPSRGLRQGDPLSPYLFLFVVDVLSRSLQRGMLSGLIKGIRIGRHCPTLSHLLFADDSLFFLKADKENCMRAIQKIQEYCKAFGQKVNLEKSCVVFTGNVPMEKKGEIVRSLGVKKAINIGVYLGISSF